MTLDQINELVKNRLDTGLKVTTTDNGDGSTTVKVSTSFVVSTDTPPAGITAALKSHLISAQTVFHSLISGM